MHIPDGFLDAKTAVATGVIAVTGLGMALRAVRRTVEPRRIPLIGLAAAFIFAAQMLNFPILFGTSGHLIGAVLATVLLGPSAAILALSAVLILQCFMFADGGVTALGANLFNMALLAPTVGYGVYALLIRVTQRDLRGRLFAIAFAAWCSTVVASIACAAELTLSNTVAWNLAFSAMAGLHMLIGVGEAVITTLVVAAVARTRPDLLTDRVDAETSPRYREFALYGLLVSAGMVVLIAPWACSWPDGLERVAASLGFESRAISTPAPLSDYAVPGIRSAVPATVAAGLIGTVLAFLLAYAVVRLLTPPSAARKGAGGSRLAATMLFAGTVAFLPRTAWTAYEAAAAILLLALLLSRVPLGRFALRLLYLEPFVVGVSLLALFQAGGPSIFFALLAKSTLCLGAMVWFSTLTPFSDVLDTLKGLRVPPLLVTTLALMYRYLFLLSEEVRRLRRARSSRTFSATRSHAWASLATVAAHLFIRTSERAERLYLAMCARGWTT